VYFALRFAHILFHFFPELVQQFHNFGLICLPESLRVCPLLLNFLLQVMLAALKRVDGFIQLIDLLALIFYLYLIALVLGYAYLQLT
jgi:hypothetical protein